LDLPGASSTEPQLAHNSAHREEPPHETRSPWNRDTSKPTAKARVLSRAETLAEIALVDFVPALRPATNKLSKALAQSSVSLEEIVALLSQDSLLSLSVLKAANALLPLSVGKVEEMAMAVQTLGVRRLEELARTHWDAREELDSGPELDWRPLYIHSLAVALIAEKLSEWTNVGRPVSLYFAGLWHDAGKVLLSHISPESYGEILSLASTEGVELETLEMQYFGVTHAEAGMIYADRCGVGPLILQVIAHHATPETAQLERGGTAIVSIANHLANVKGIGFSGHYQNADSKSEASLAGLAAWTVLMAETGLKHDVPALYRALQPFLKSLASELEVIRQSL
jgi:HD-like signal output (HDOD) protein